MKANMAFWALPLFGMLAMPAIADHKYRYDDHENRFEQRLDRQDWRIRQGVRSGELTHREAKHLREQQRHIASMERWFSPHGKPDRHERRTLQRELNAASDRIYRLKHNDRYRGHPGHQHGRYGYHNHDGHYGPKHHDHQRGYDDTAWAVRLRLWDYL
jgi:hypothetical protein